MTYEKCHQGKINILGGGTPGMITINYIVAEKADLCNENMASRSSIPDNEKKCSMVKLAFFQR